jgi:hypothetical protein
MGVLLIRSDALEDTLGMFRIPPGQVQKNHTRARLRHADL